MVVLIATNSLQKACANSIKSLSQCHIPKSYKYSLIVENGAKTQDLNCLAPYKECLKIQYLFYPYPNKSGALNFALNHIDSDSLIYFTDDDAKYEKDVLISFSKIAKNYDKKRFFGGAMKVIYEKNPPQWLHDLLPASAKGWTSDESQDYLMTPRFLGINWAAYAEDIQCVGGFNEQLGPGTKPKRTGQEWDMQQRLLAAGYQATYVPDAVVWHTVPKARSSYSWLLKRRFQGGFGKGISFFEEYGRRKFPKELFSFTAKHLLLFPLNLFSFSLKKLAGNIANIAAGLGRLKGYLYALKNLHNR